MLCSSKVIFCGERPILSLIVSFKVDILVLVDRDSAKEGPMVG